MHDKFDELFSDVPADIRKQLDASMNTSTENDLTLSLAELDDDEGLILNEYNSDEEIDAAAKDADGEDDHVTKVIGLGLEYFH